MYFNSFQGNIGAVKREAEDMGRHSDVPDYSSWLFWIGCF